MPQRRYARRLEKRQVKQPVERGEFRYVAVFARYLLHPQDPRSGLEQVGALLRSPEIIAQTWAAVRRERETEISERDVIEALGEFEPLWDELFPAEQARIVRLLVERVDLSLEGIDVRLRAEGLRALAEELRLKEAA